MVPADAAIVSIHWWVLIYQMNSTSNNVSIEYRKCAGKGCDRVGRTILKVRYLNKTGLFCDSCVDDLVAADIAIRVEEYPK
jgi:hypothetical protein